MNVPMWYSQMVKVNGLLPALGPAGFYGPYKLTYLRISNQPLILLRFPSPRDSHKHSPTTGNRLVAIGGDCLFPQDVDLLKIKKV